MSNPNFEDEEEKPLDPAAERLQAKLKGLLLVSSLIMGLGLTAVLSAIIYRVVKDDGEPDWATRANIEALIEDPLTGDIVGTSLDGSRMAITLRTEKGLRVLVVDVNSGSVQRQVDLIGQR
ncbi:MAG: hypothetical protein C0606_17135 [Hyphomicrobiales bacterium]|nr:MAG: hypothetical protein C0606_17135 [Hyphomicrobiales bacterium]